MAGGMVLSVREALWARRARRTPTVAAIATAKSPGQPPTASKAMMIVPATLSAASTMRKFMASTGVSPVLIGKRFWAQGDVLRRGVRPTPVGKAVLSIPAEACAEVVLNRIQQVAVGT